LEPLTEQNFFDAFFMEIVAFCPFVSLIPASTRIAFEVRDLPLATVGIWTAGTFNVGVVCAGEITGGAIAVF
jgi:hypothetical protein